MGSDTAALVQLREQLGELQRRKGLTRATLMARAQVEGIQLGKTTVSQALNHGNPCPSRRTVYVLARLMGADKTVIKELDDLWLRACGHANPGTAAADGSLLTVEQAGPVALEVHQAVLPAPDAGGYPYLTPYLLRAHDRDLRDRLMSALEGGASVLVMLTGDSSTGKTRALYEALRDLAPDRPLLRPATASDLLELLRSGQVSAERVLWLNEAQRVLYGTDAQRAAAELRRVLTTTRGTVAVGTLWTKPYWEDLTMPGADADPHAHVRALLEPPVTQRVTVPDELSPEEQGFWRERASGEGDQRLRDALVAGAADGRVVQHLSGGPALLRAYLSGPGQHFTRAEHAVLTAAVDARRLGHRAPIPAALLADAAYAALPARHRPADADWANTALTALSTGKRPDGGRADIRHTLTALIAVRERPGNETAYEPADYLDQQLRDRRADQMATPSLWQALLTHTTDPHDLGDLAVAAQTRGLFKHAVRLWHKALLAQHPGAPNGLIELLTPTTDPGRIGAQWIAAHADLADPAWVDALMGALRKARQRKAVGRLADRIATGVDPTRTWTTATLLRVLQDARQFEAVARLAERAATHADTRDVRGLSRLLEALRDAGQPEAVARLADRAAPTDLRDVEGLFDVLWGAGHHKTVLRLADRADPTDSAVTGLLHWLHRRGQHAVVSRLARRVAAHADPTDPGKAAYLLQTMREAGQHESVSRFAHRTAAGTDPTSPGALTRLLEALGEAGEHEATSRLAHRAATQTDVTDLHGVDDLLRRLRQDDQREAVTRLIHRAVAAHPHPTHPGHIATLLHVLREDGQHEAVARLADHAASKADTHNDKWGASRWLLDQLREAGQHEPWTRLAHRVTDPEILTDLLNMLRKARQRKAVAQLAEHAGAHADLTRPRRAVRLVGCLWKAGQHQAVARLADRVDLIDPRDFAELLNALRKAGQHETVDRLAEQVAAHADLTDPSVAARLLTELWVAGRHDAVNRLAARAVVHTRLTDPAGVVSLMHLLQHAELHDGISSLLDRDPASDVHLTNEYSVAHLLETLCEAGRPDAAARLADRTATHAQATNPESVAHLLNVLRAAGQHEHARAFEHRALNAGSTVPSALHPYGREIDGTLAEPWAWHTLGLQLQLEL
ncbi:hypothetical protein ACFY8N_39115 [Streptomyces collinus]|uniref:hypothetical protein n=1 Tax=Streptomyces collinus TaxID=42684 RepID=UPI0036C4713D